MNNSTNDQDLALGHKRIQLLFRFIIMAIIGSLVVGLIGGYLVYQMMPAGKFPAVLLSLPAFIALFAFFIPIVITKKNGFPHLSLCKQRRNISLTKNKPQFFYQRYY